MDDQQLILNIDGMEKEIPVESLPVTIGRYDENAFVLSHDYISGKHGQIFFENGEFFYRDLNSTNGTYVDSGGSSLQFIRNEAVRLSSSGRLVFGEEGGAEIVYRLEDVEWREETGVERLSRKGYTSLKNGEFQAALAFFEQILDKQPQTPIAYYYAAFAASKLDQLDAGILRFEQYLTLRPRDTEAMIDLGRLYERKGSLDKARARYQKALNLHPQDQNALSRLKNLKRYEPVGVPSGKSKSTGELLGTIVDTVTTQHFVVTYNVARHGRRLNDVLKILEEAYLTVGDHLNIHPTNHVPVRLCTETEGVADDQIEIDAAGAYSEKRIKAVLSARTTFELPFLKVLLTHEYVHFLIDSIVPEGRSISWWLHEGIAQYESQNLTLDSEAMMAEMAHCDSFIPVQVLEKGIHGFEAKELVQLAYSQAYSMVDYLVDKHGPDAISMILKELCDGTAIEDAFEKKGINYETFESDWQAWLERRLKRAQRGKTKRI